MWNTFHWIDRLTDWLTDLLVLNWLSDSEWNRVRYDLALFGGSGLPARAVCVFVVCAVQLAFWPLTVYGVNARCVCMWLAGYTTFILLSVYGVNRKQKQQRPSRRPRELCVCVAHTRRKWKALCSMTRCVCVWHTIDRCIRLLYTKCFTHHMNGAGIRCSHARRQVNVWQGGMWVYHTLYHIYC